nr:isotrichodermin c-15 hydroxylase [Quercus suber]
MIKCALDTRREQCWLQYSQRGYRGRYIVLQVLVHVAVRLDIADSVESSGPRTNTSEHVMLQTAFRDFGDQVRAMAIGYYLAKAIYNVYFHPLRHIPGPKINAVTKFVWIRHIVAGTTLQYNQMLHKKYGPVVRFTPDEISFTTGETAWPDIYGFRTGKLKGHLNMPKDPAWYPRSAGGVDTLITENDAEHTRSRKILSHAFSERALFGQEHLIQSYVDLMVSRLQEITTDSKMTANMTEWYNWITFDIISDLLFGESFGGLRDMSTHKYVSLLLGNIQSFGFMYIIKSFPWTEYVGAYLGLIDNKVIEQRKDYGRWVHQQAQKRCESDTQRPDFMTHILAHNSSKEEGASLSPEKIYGTCELLLGAGTETTSTFLAGVTYALLKNPTVLQKLTDEVRGRWSTYDEITIDQVSKAPYLVAVVHEGLRSVPPVPIGFPRRTAAGGEVVSGVYIPEDTSLSVSQFSAYHDENNFKDPDEFVPERWMGAKRYENDKRNALQPFSFGPRNCLGKNLAYAEMRLILAKMVWSFDMELDARSQNWMEDMRCSFFWKKPELAVHLRKPRQSSDVHVWEACALPAEGKTTGFRDGGRSEQTNPASQTTSDLQSHEDVKSLPDSPRLRVRGRAYWPTLIAQHVVEEGVSMAWETGKSHADTDPVVVIRSLRSS